MNKNKSQPMRYLVKRIVRTDRKGNTESRNTCLEVSDIEDFRRQQKGRRFKCVELVYEQLDKQV